MRASDRAILLGRIQTASGVANALLQRYGHGGIAVQLSAEDGSPIGSLSVAIADCAGELAPDEFFVKTYSENEAFAKPALQSGLFEDTGRIVRAGYLTFPVWRIKPLPSRVSSIDAAV